MAAPAVRSNVFNTPLDIYQALTEYFPMASAHTDVDGNELISLTVTISGQPPFVLTKAVDARSFSTELSKLSRRIQLDKIVAREVPHPLKQSRFSTEVPLRDWQRFQRVMYERNRGSCSNAIVEYLKNPAAERLAVLSSLGLAPEQVRGNLRETDFTYFRSISEILQRLDEREKESMIQALDTSFPEVWRRILHERAEIRTREEVRRSRNPYQEILLRLQEQVFGQDLATQQLAAALTSQRRQEGNQVFLFIGPTGVGKTQLAKAVASNKQGFVFFEMNQYTSSADVWKLFGSATGYVGSSDKPHFAKMMDKYVLPNSDKRSNKRQVENLVVLFDEFEKANTVVKQSLLTLFDEGRCAVQYTSEGSNRELQYIFKSCIFVCTSNLFQDFILQCFQRRAPITEIREGFCELNRRSVLQDACSPELLGRVTIIPFGPIPRGECYQRLLKSKLTEFFADFKKELSCREIVVENEPAVLLALEGKLYGDGIDIRRVSRYFAEIKALVYRESSSWGDFATKKLTLLHDAPRGICLRASVFDPDFNRYSDVSFEIRIP